MLVCWSYVVRTILGAVPIVLWERGTQYGGSPPRPTLFKNIGTQLCFGTPDRSWLEHLIARYDKCRMLATRPPQWSD